MTSSLVFGISDSSIYIQDAKFNDNEGFVVSNPYNGENSDTVFFEYTHQESSLAHAKGGNGGFASINFGYSQIVY